MTELLCNVAAEFVAQFKYTVLLMPNGPMKITGLPVDTSLYNSEYSVQDEEMKVRGFSIEHSGGKCAKLVYFVLKIGTLGPL